MGRISLFNLNTYVSEDGSKKRPVMVHRALFGSLERFIGIITEHFAGLFPLWLAPVQLNVIPVNNQYHLEYAKEIYELLKENGFRVEPEIITRKSGKGIKLSESVNLNLTKEENKILIEYFPFLQPRNVWTDKIPEDYDYSYINGIGEIPKGWEKLFLQLCEDIPMDSCVMAFNKTFECKRLEELASLYPDLKEHLLNISSNIVDLADPFSDASYYHKDMGKRYSIKSVLPALYPNDPELDYHSLDYLMIYNESSHRVEFFPKKRNFHRGMQSFCTHWYCFTLKQTKTFVLYTVIKQYCYEE